MRKCLDCPADITGRHLNCTRCDHCSRLAKNAKTKAWKIAHKQPIRKCARCNGDTGGRRDRRHCGPCRVLLKREKAAAWFAANPQRAVASARAWRHRNPDKARAYGKAYRAKNPEGSRLRARLKRAFCRSGRTGVITSEQWADLCAEYNNRCAYCLVSEQLTMDHFVPLAQAGANEVSNIVPACLRCNSGKGPRTFLLWFAKRRGCLGSTTVLVT